MLSNVEPTLEQMQSAVRANICAHCFRRPPGSENLASDQPRTCEQNCRLFRVLPQLQTLVYLDPMITDFSHAARPMLCGGCSKNTGTNGCGKADDCLLNRYREKTLFTLQQLMNHKRG